MKSEAQKRANKKYWRSEKGHEAGRRNYKNHRKTALIRNKKYHTRNQAQISARMRAYVRKRKYGISVNGVAQLRFAQHNQCAICFLPFEKEPHVDHNHQTNTVRGLLCGKCNLGLGLFNDSPKLLDSAIQYLGKIKILKVA